LGLYALDEVDNNVNPAPAPSNGGGSGSAAPAPAPAVVPTLAPAEVTPNPDGSITHVVQSGDTLWTIAIRYAPVLGITPEEALPQIRELNNDPAFISVGDELLIKAPGEPLPVEDAPAEEAPAAEATTEEAPAAETTAEEAPAPEAAAEEAPAAEQPQPELISEPAPSAICVTAFDDANGDGLRQADSESLLANAAISLFREGTTVATYVSDGVSEPYCFQDLEADTYQVQVFPPADYVASGAATWAVAVSDGAQIPVEFGVQYSPAQPVEQPTDGPNINETAAATTPEAPAAESGGLFSGVGGIILAVVVFLVLLLGVGVFLVRRG